MARAGEPGPKMREEERVNEPRRGRCGARQSLMWQLSYRAGWNICHHVDTDSKSTCPNSPHKPDASARDAAWALADASGLCSRITHGHIVVVRGADRDRDGDQGLVGSGRGYLSPQPQQQ